MPPCFDKAYKCLGNLRAPGKWEPGGDSYQPSQPRGPCRGPGEGPGRLSITSPCGGEQGPSRGSALATAVHMGSELGASQTPAVSFLGAHQPQIPPHERPTSHPGLPPPPSLPFRVSGQKPQELRPETDGQPLRLPWGCRSARPPARPRGVSSRTPGFSWPRTERSAAAPRLQGPDRTGWEGVGRPPMGTGMDPGGPGVRPDGGPSGRARGSRAVGLRPARLSPPWRPERPAPVFTAQQPGPPAPEAWGPQETPIPEGGTHRPPRLLDGPRAQGRALSGSEDAGGSGDLAWPERKRLRTNPRAPGGPAP